MSQILDLNTLADGLAQRLNCRQIGDWLNALALTFAVPISALLPTPTVQSHHFSAAGLTLTLSHPHAGHVEEGDPNRWLITDVKLDVLGQSGARWGYPLPFGLDAQTETPSSAQQKLGDNTTELSARDLAVGDRRQSFFLDKALVIEIVWRPELKGIERITMVRLGGELLQMPDS
ncbi:hypothetical protein [Chitinibacter sp. GC72]|uniref:hypothetical protein n=1 Tax=Chitinibacter sp. GC72 TaxID=1526917 RepID=UPI0012F7FBB9|nr:hypothetical protein [Chitinibacter sp. GC72]